MKARGTAATLAPHRARSSRLRGLGAGWSDAIPSMRIVAATGAALALALALLAMLARCTHDPAVGRVFPHSVTPPFNSALAVALLAVAWVLPRVARGVLAVLAAVLAAVSLAEHVAGHGLGVDQLFVTQTGGSHPGRMSFAAAVLCLVLAAGHLSALARRERAAELLGIAVGCLGGAWLIGYAYSATSWWNRESITDMSTSTVVAMVLLAISALAATPDGVLQWLCVSRDAGADLARRLLPSVLVALPLIGLAFVSGQRAGWYSSSVAAAQIVVVSAALAGVCIWIAAQRVQRYDSKRARAIAELTELRIGLERQVHERAQQLRRRQEEIAILEDRQRIAADLHDIVIQRLFAAGMYLQSRADEVDAVTRRSLDEAVETMDSAIRDLRASIFELGRADAAQHLHEAIEDVALDSSRVLGFRPRTVLSDPDGAADAFADDILAVLREALANVGRHAAASSATVELRVADGWVQLTVVDDGRGIAEGGYRSGTRNMEQRAREFGGDCVWTRAHPRGTRVIWRVPVRRSRSGLSAVG